LQGGLKESLLALDSGLDVAQSEVGALRIELQKAKGGEGGGISEEYKAADEAGSGVANAMGEGMDTPPERSGGTPSTSIAQAVELQFFHLAGRFVVRFMSAEIHHLSQWKGMQILCTMLEKGRGGGIDSPGFSSRGGRNVPNSSYKGRKTKAAFRFAASFGLLKWHVNES
jgi:hypothetical protein